MTFYKPQTTSLLLVCLDKRGRVEKTLEGEGREGKVNSNSFPLFRK